MGGEILFQSKWLLCNALNKAQGPLYEKIKILVTVPFSKICFSVLFFDYRAPSVSLPMADSDWLGHAKRKIVDRSLKKGLFFEQLFPGTNETTCWGRQHPQEDGRQTGYRGFAETHLDIDYEVKSAWFNRNI